MRGAIRHAALATVLAAAAAAVTAVTASPAEAATSCETPGAVGHRGSPVVATENTLPSFQTALSAGVAYIEADVRFTRNGAAMLMHDRTVARTTNGTGYIASMTSQAVRALRTREGYRVPYMSSLLRMLQARGGRVLLDLKTVPTSAQLGLVMRRVREYRLGARTVIMSKDTTTLQRIRAAGLSAGLLDSLGAAPRAVAAWVARWDVVTAERVSRWEAAGSRVFAWTLNDPAGWQAAADAGAGYVITDRPSDYLAWAANYCAA